VDTTVAREKLSKRRAEILETAVIKTDSVSNKDERIDEIVPAQVESKLTQNRVNELRAIDRALKRIDSGTYGTCRGCGENIEEARLNAKLEAERCVGCEEKRESPIMAPAKRPQYQAFSGRSMLH